MVFEEPSNCLAPMVRINTTPMRLLALEYGADFVYSEELVAQSLSATTRHENLELGTTDWVRPAATKQNDKVILRISERERSRLILQIGAAEAVPALEAASMVADRVAAIDLNMGCPQHFSLSGGMGAALLQKPETAADILSTLRRNLNIPITAKIRLLPTAAETLELAKRLEACGISALAVHCREPHQRSRQPARWDELPAIVAELGIPVVANGDIFKYADFDRVRRETGCHSVMAARGAIWNASIFRRSGEADLLREVMPRYVGLSAEVRNHPTNTKSVLIDMLERKGARGSLTAAAAGFVADRALEPDPKPEPVAMVAEDGQASWVPWERIDDGSVILDECAVQALLKAREGYKGRKQWSESDALQLQLRMTYSVRVNDKLRQYAAVGPDGRCGKRRAGQKELAQAVYKAKSMQELEAAVQLCAKAASATAAAKTNVATLRPQPPDAI